MALKTTNKNRKKIENKIKKVESKELSIESLKKILFGISIVLLLIFVI